MTRSGIHRELNLFALSLTLSPSLEACDARFASLALRFASIVLCLFSVHAHYASARVMYGLTFVR